MVLKLYTLHHLIPQLHSSKSLPLNLIHHTLKYTTLSFQRGCRPIIKLDDWAMPSLYLYNVHSVFLRAAYSDYIPCTVKESPVLLSFSHNFYGILIYLTYLIILWMSGSSEPAFLFLGRKMECCSIDDSSSILQRPHDCFIIFGTNVNFLK